MTFDDEKKIKDEKNELKDIRRVQGARYQSVRAAFIEFAQRLVIFALISII